MTVGGSPTAKGWATACTVVHLSADDSPAMRNLSVLMAWLARRPDVDLHTVLWLPGWADTAPFRVGTFHDVAKDHRGALARLARKAGRHREAGALVARAARSNLASIPPGGTVYLNGAETVVALRYMPAGERRVVTHLLESDRNADLAPERIEQLLAVTDEWLADSEETRTWAVDSWGLTADDVSVVGELVDLELWNQRNRPPDQHHLDLAVMGGPWFASDHTARLVQRLLKLRPELELDLFWAEVERAEHLAPLLHDLRILGIRDRVRLPESHEEVHHRLQRSHVLALTSPDGDTPWLPWEAARNGLPVVCFDTHRHAHEVGSVVRGHVVDYLDVPAMADAVLAVIDEARMPTTSAHEMARSELADRDVAHVGERLLGDRDEHVEVGREQP